MTFASKILSSKFACHAPKLPRNFLNYKLITPRELGILRRQASTDKSRVLDLEIENAKLKKENAAKEAENARLLQLIGEAQGRESYLLNENVRMAGEGRALLIVRDCLLAEMARWRQSSISHERRADACFAIAGLYLRKNIALQNQLNVLNSAPQTKTIAESQTPAKPKAKPPFKPPFDSCHDGKPFRDEEDGEAVAA